MPLYSQPLTEEELRDSPVEVTSALSDTATRTSITAAITSTTLLVLNTVRLGATIFNDSTATLFIGLGSTVVSVTDFTVRLGKHQYFELPFGFTGEIRGIWSAVNGSARITELT